ncbi:MAG: hypothetical protein HYT88_03435 [Candidatus Omnitrophica bacterium]|nr:hypothetical protein [Candidatus Omnitrophota bacterium]
MTPFLIIAHRGASAVAPESTAAAILAAARCGAHMVELDVEMTKEGRLIIFHDERLERTTDGKGQVRHTSLMALKRLDAGSWFHPRFRQEKVLLVAEALSLLPSWMGVNLELKRTRQKAALLQRLEKLITRIHFQQRLLFSSFDPGLLKPICKPAIPTALLCRQEAERSLRHAIRIGCAAWHPHWEMATRHRIATAHAAGLRVHVWTVDKPVLAHRFRQWGVDGVFTNNPALLNRSLPQVWG